MTSIERDEGIVSGFEERVRQSPHAVAVLADGIELSYAQLDHRADRLAQRLRARGVGPEVLVALCVRRGPLMLVGLLAVWKAGGAYLPLDPGHPHTWIRQILETSGTSLLLTESALSLATGGLTDASICIDDEMAADVPTAAAAPVRAAHLAYCIYTSGTTGAPKGVAVGGRSLLAHARAMQRLLALQPGDRVLQTTPLCIDAALEEILPALLAGATIVLPATAMLPGPGFMQYLEDQQVSVVSLATSLWEHWVDAAGAASWTRPSRLRLVFVGGERVLAEKLRRWQLLPWTNQVDWITDYGPTEATISCTVYRPPRPFLGDLVPIGWPIDGAAIHLLDSALEPVATGEVGEIWIGGSSPARGYLGQPALTADAFRPDPWGNRGSRMYRSGDLARRSAAGDLLFLGREDEQIKLDGHRIELAGIENSLLLCPGVRDAAVALHQTAAGRARLVAYLVGDGLAIADVRGRLAALLPTQMVPDEFLVLDELPRAQFSGKLQRTGLPAPALAADGMADPDRIDELVRARWIQAVGHAPHDDSEDFFRSGGDSLRAMRLLAQLRLDLGVDADFADLYRAPTVSGLASVLTQRRDRGERSAWLAAGGAGSGPRSDPRRGPASHGQQRLWFMERYHEGSAAYAVPVAFRVRGRFPVHQLDRALSALVARHEALRTGLAMEGDQLVQRVVSPCPVRTDQRKAGTLNDALATAAAELARPFDLAEPPLLRSLCISCADGDRLWVLNIHHSACDAWSLGLVFDELRAELDGLPPPAAPPQYAAFVERQQAWLGQPVAQVQREFWQAALAGDLPRLNLGHRVVRQRADDARGAIEALRFDRSLTAAMRAMAAERGTTVYVVALSAFAAVLQRWTLQDRIVIGVPAACRPTPSDECTVGFFANTLAVCIDIDPSLGLGALVAHVAGRMAAALAHQELPLDHVVDALGLPSRNEPNPLFQAMFVGQDAPLGQGFALRDCVVEEVVVHNGTAKSDVCVMLRSNEGGLTGEMEYSLGAMTQAGAASLASAYQNLLAAGLRTPALRIDELPALSVEAQRAQAAAINAVHAVYDETLPLGGHVDRMARERPDDIAVEAGEVALSYRQLSSRANRLAVALRAAGLGPERLVGVCMDRSAAMVVALLGVLRAGAGFVPLSPRAPRQRTAAIVADAGIAHVITQPHCEAALSGLGARLWFEDGLGSGGAAPPEAGARPEHIAYVYYTSGTTGSPKGVAIDHRCAMNRLAWLNQRYPLRPGDRVLHKTPLTFDVAIWEIFGPLMAGATLVAADPDAEADAAHIADLLAMPRMVFGHFVPSMLDAYLRASPRPPAPDLRWVQMSGEAPSPGLVQRFRDYARIELHNCYGQTETSEVATWEDDGAPVADRVPMGRQVGVYRLFVLDRALMPVPAGMPGELCVSGVGGLARGYHGRPAWTAERFVPHPYPKVPGERLYRTGDLVCFDADGRLENLGRLDGQVKVRGCRVEIAEIETVLLQLPGLHRCAVTATRDADGFDQLVAYVVGGGLSAQAIGEHAERHLPHYMLPAVYVQLAELPLTGSGKLDRLRLPPPAAGHFESRGGSAAPEPGLESELAGLWLQVLGVGRVGRSDNFFAIGGNSLKAIQVLTRIRSSFGVRLSVRAFFEEPTVAGLARQVDAALVEWVASMPEDEAERRFQETSA